MNPIEEIANALGLTTEQAAALTWPQLQAHRKQLQALLEQAVDERRQTAQTN